LPSIGLPDVGLPDSQASQAGQPLDLPVLRARVDPIDIIDPARRYTSRELAELLGVDREQIAAGIMGNAFVELFSTSDLRHSQHGQVSGTSVIAWLRQAKPACRIPAGIQPAKPAAGKKPPAAPPVEQPKTAGGRLEQQLREAGEREQTELAAARAAAWRQLVPLLERGDERTEAEIILLAEISSDVGLDSHTLAQAQDAVLKLARARRLAAQRVELAAALRAANEAFRETRKRCEAQIDQARKAARQAESDHRGAMEAESDIADLRRRWPQIFVD